MTVLDPVATTSRVTAAMRAAEFDRPDRLFADPFAAALAGDDGRQLAARMHVGDTIAVRTRFVDDQVLLAGLTQLVLPAAGMDTGRGGWTCPPAPPSTSSTGPSCSRSRPTCSTAPRPGPRGRRSAST